MSFKNKKRLKKGEVTKRELQKIYGKNYRKYLERRKFRVKNFTVCVIIVFETPKSGEING